MVQDLAYNKRLMPPNKFGCDTAAAPLRTIVERYVKTMEY